MGRRTGRSWATGLGGALAVHAAMVLAVVLTVKIASPPKEAPAFVVRLVQPWRPPPEPARQPPPRSTPQRALPAPVSAAPAAPIRSSNAAEAAPAPAPSDDDLAKVRSVLRGSFACSQAR